MKFLFLSTLFLALNVQSAPPTYYSNDGESSPGFFDSKSNEPLKENIGETKKVIKKSTTTTIEKQEEQELDNKPVMDSNPNDETYKVGPLKPGVPDSTIPEEMQAREEDALDYSTSPDRTTVPQPEEEE